MYCNYCGTPIAADQTICTACGKSTIEARTMVAARSRVAGHLDLLGVLWYVRGVFWIIPAGVMCALACVTGGHFGLDLRSVPRFAPLLFTSLALLFLGFAAASFTTGYGLRNLRPWGRTLALVMAFLGLLDPPFGTALGIYTLYVLLPAAAGDQYARMSGVNGYAQVAQRPA